MRKALLDTSTYVDLRRAGKSRRELWAQNTLRNAIAYRNEYPKFTISAYTVFEVLGVIYRDGIPDADEEFIRKVLPGFEVLYPDQEIIGLGAKIHAKLAVARQSVGVVDALIAATAIVHGLLLVNANTRHFRRDRSRAGPEQGPQRPDGARVLGTRRTGSRSYSTRRI